MNGLDQFRQAVELYDVTRTSANPKMQKLLDRLEFVEKRGHQFRAKCPAHNGKSRGSLSLRETEDGRILIHCFGGCNASEVVRTCGLSLSDLMPERITDHAAPEERLKWRQEATHREWRQAMDEARQECRIIWLAGKQIREGEILSIEDGRRVDNAMKKIWQIWSRFDGIT